MATVCLLAIFVRPNPKSLYLNLSSQPDILKCWCLVLPVVIITNIGIYSMNKSDFYNLVNRQTVVFMVCLWLSHRQLKMPAFSI